MKRAIVLIVEDEAIIRMSAVAMVEDAGYVAIEASNAEEAIKTLEIRNDIGIVFTDINMPGSMDGLRLAQAIQKRWLRIRLIVTSGKIVPKSEELPANGRFIRKPYDSSQLSAALQELAA